MATYTVLNTVPDQFGPGIDHVTLEVDFEKPEGTPRTFVQEIMTNNGGFFTDLPLGPVSKENQPAFFQAYADDYETEYVPPVDDPEDPDQQ